MGRMNRPTQIILLAFLAAPLWAQHQKHHLWGGLGAAQPRGDLDPYFRDAFAWGLGYGYRPVKFFQVDAGLEGAYRAGRVEDFFDSPAFGPLQVRDFQFFVPFGGRLIAPFADGRFELFGGAGGAYVRYTEMLRQPSDFIQVGCPVCGARDGFGYYTLAGANVALDRNRTFKLGFTVKMYDASTDGRPVGQVPAVSTSDRWINSYLHFTFSF